MTEQRLPYNATSSDPNQTIIVTTDASPLVQHYADGTVVCDILLLLPILVSQGSYERPSPCMQPVRLPNGDLGFCNDPSSDECACCTAPVCASHSYSIWIALPDEVGLYCDDKHARLCETCFFLSRAMRAAIHTLVVRVNGIGEAVDETARRSVKVPQAAVPICQRRDCPWNASRRVTLQTTQEVAFPTALNGLIFPSRRTTFDLCSGCYHFDIKRDKAFQIIDIAPLSWPEVQS